jgi:hypothetical protein
MWVLLMLPRFGGANHAKVTTIGLDIAKSVFQVHGVDAEGNVLIRPKRKSAPRYPTSAMRHKADIHGRQVHVR